MVVCIACGGSGFSLDDGPCSECNGTGEGAFDYDAIIFDDGSEDTRRSESTISA